MPTNAERAVAAYVAMQRFLYAADGTSLYREAYPWRGGNPYAYVWPFSRALIGTLSLAILAGTEYQRAVDDRLAGLAHYWDATGNPPAYDSYVGPPLGQGGDKYFDDNVWIALALADQYRRGGPVSSLHRAQQLFEFGRSGWDRRRGRSPGGVFWVEQGRGQGQTNHDRGAGLTAGYARLGFLLHELTGSSADEAVAMVNWVDANLNSRRGGSGLYWNAVRRDGSIDTNLWTYVQGEMIGARALQYRLTHDTRYLDQAEGIARQTLATFGTLTGQPPPFNAMCAACLLLLSTLTSDTALRAAIVQTIQAYAEWAWNASTGAREQTTNLFYFTSAGVPAGGSGQPAYLQDQGAMVQLYALLAEGADQLPLSAARP